MYLKGGCVMRQKNVLEWLENSAEKYPDAVAFHDPDQEITYRDLLRAAHRIGSVLAERIPSKENPGISFCMEKSVLAVEGMFATVYARGFYSFMDMHQPLMRQRHILRVLKPALILCDDKNREAAEKLGAETGVEVMVLEELLKDAQENNGLLKDIRRMAMDTDLLYVNFTSGSTGVPKGVAVTHRSVIDFIDAFDAEFGFNRDDVFANQAPFDFDVSVKDIYGGISCGAEAVLVPREYFSRPAVLMDYLCDNRVTVLVWAVSAMCFVSIMNGLAYRVPEAVRLVLFSGEVMPLRQLAKWQKALPECQFVNLYGPTEVTCNCTFYRLDQKEYGSDEVLPIGKPFDNEAVFLLSNENTLIDQPGETGEICVCGSCLAAGYYGDQKRTDAVFTDNPLQKNIHERMYHTGDLGRYLPDGNLIFCGRKDFQIKLLGHRIEPGEIEAACQKMPEVNRACVLFDAKRKRLLLFYSGSRDPKTVQAGLRETLPAYMMPSRTIHLEEMPMTANGKMDRKKMAEIGGIA